MFYNPTDFEFVSELEANWQTIKQELLALPTGKFIPWKETSLYDTGWDVFGLYGFGRKMDENCNFCPQTTKLVESIPGMFTAGFSSLKPNTHIKPHIGYHYEYSETGELITNKVLNGSILRLHLGLVIPKTETHSDCSIRVVDRVKNWQEGKCLIFDDTMVHEAWNRTEETRVVLIVDFRVFRVQGLHGIVFHKDPRSLQTLT
jgi:beta-hydroxylase